MANEFDTWVCEVFGPVLNSYAQASQGSDGQIQSRPVDHIGDKATSAQGGQSPPATPAATPRKKLTEERATDSPEFNKSLKDAWAAAKQLVKDDSKKWERLGKDLKAAEAAGKGPGDWLDGTPADKITVYKDDKGNVAGLTFVANMANDDDGTYTSTGNAAKTHDSNTSLKWKVGGKDANLDPTQIPYVALPPELVQASGAHYGDIVRMKDGDKVVYGIFGDGGPHLKAGEASMKVQELFGRGLKGDLGDSDKNQRVEYTIIKGSGAKNGLGQGGTPHTSDEIQALGAAEFEAFSGGPP